MIKKSSANFFYCKTRIEIFEATARYAGESVQAAKFYRESLSGKTRVREEQLIA